MRPPSTVPGGVGTTPKRRSSMPRAVHREWLYSRLVRRVPATRWGNLAPSVAAGPGDQEDGARRGGVEEDGGKHIGHGGIVLYRHGSSIRCAFLDGDAA